MSAWAPVEITSRALVLSGQSVGDLKNSSRTQGPSSWVSVKQQKRGLQAGFLHSALQNRRMSSEIENQFEGEKWGVHGEFCLLPREVPLSWEEPRKRRNPNSYQFQGKGDGRERATGKSEDGSRQEGPAQQRPSGLAHMKSCHPNKPKKFIGVIRK
ncbi:hypothetical protein BD779DRAFT_1480807 [Infundibulicybe gibba]|nr:hypothetical protein BD779DRAFT_1480807 [Infundibulicybe gibba]